MTFPFAFLVHQRLLVDAYFAPRCRSAHRIFRSSAALLGLLFVHSLSQAQDAAAPATGAPAKPAAEPVSAAEPDSVPAPEGGSGTPAAASPASEATTSTPAAQPPEASPEAGSAPAAKEEASKSAITPASDEAASKEEPEENSDSKEEEEEEEEAYDGPGTLLGGSDNKIAFGGYGGVTVLGTTVDDRAALLVGGEAAFLIDHRLAIGFGGLGLATEVAGPTLLNGDQSALGFGYGGGILRYHFVGENCPIGVSIGALVGGGGLTYLRKLGEDEFEYDVEQDEPDAFFVVEPSTQVHLYLTRWMRLGLNGSYRFVSGVETLGLKDSDLQGFAFGGHLQFGWF